MFKIAVKEKLKAKVLLDGGSGSGKTYSALMLAEGLAEGGKIALIDTENRSASLYADRFKFDVLDLYAPFTPEKYIEAIKAAEDSGYAVLIIDSITHEWNGEGGCLDIQTNLGGRYQDWAKVTPRHNKFVGAILNSKIHVISTVRSKMGYDMGMQGNGKMGVQKVGTQPITRDGFEYEMTVVFSLNQNHYAGCSKDRTSMFDGKDFIVTRDTGKQLLEWLNSGTDNTPVKPQPEVKTTPPATKSATAKPVTTEKPKQEAPAQTEKPVTKSELTQTKESELTQNEIKLLKDTLGHPYYGEQAKIYFSEVGADMVNLENVTKKQMEEIKSKCIAYSEKNPVKDIIERQMKEKQAQPEQQKLVKDESTKLVNNPMPIDQPKKAIPGQLAAIDEALFGEHKAIMESEMDKLKVFDPKDLTFEQAKVLMVKYSTIVAKKQADAAA